MKKFTLMILVAACLAVAIRQMRSEIQAPTHANVRYGEHNAMVLDFWKAESNAPAPLFVWIHGGGFRDGDKKSVNPILLSKLLASGVSVASINYRLTDVAPYPAQMHDSARAIQFLRAKAVEWNIDKTRMASGGGSAGAGISQWLAFHDNLADPNSTDPIERESTRLVCALPINMQSTYDPRVTRQIIPGMDQIATALPAFYDLPEDWDLHSDEITPELDAKFKEASPINHLTSDDPPVFIYHSEESREPGNIHHPNFGVHLQKAMDAFGLECIRKTSADYPKNDSYISDMTRFILRQFKMPTPRQSRSKTISRKTKSACSQIWPAIPLFRRTEVRDMKSLRFKTIPE